MSCLSGLGYTGTQYLDFWVRSQKLDYGAKYSDRGTQDNVLEETAAN